MGSTESKQEGKASAAKKDKNLWAEHFGCCVADGRREVDHMAGSMLSPAEVERTSLKTKEDELESTRCGSPTSPRSPTSSRTSLSQQSLNPQVWSEWGHWSNKPSSPNAKPESSRTMFDGIRYR
eukprot:gnl/TRDRNA2_/TRDRNA2_61006_c0_seq1.p1 gnl/TRDRNA2_/TRDRNA2_61006_c0~~gnl/TRDRNA2_/TRDRNA2_61006_c0_seq1.p1  ORF type:complete len:124 (+),score=16.88 gnl/TRDRNA2_/TRDRNA2_61006_c0_seq1:83-454(+)